MIRLQQVSKTFGPPAQPVYALRDMDLDVAAGEALAVIGPSGSGKTTLLDIVGTLSRPGSGRYELLGQDVGKLSAVRLAALRNAHFGFVFQSFHLLRERSVYDNVALPLQYSPRLGGRRARILEALAAVGLTDKERTRAGVLSGGEQQRVAIARAIVNDPRVILADEPTGNLDSATGELIIGVLLRLWQEGRTLLVITHNETLAQRCPRIVRLLDGRKVVDSRREPSPEVRP